MELRPRNQLEGCESGCIGIMVGEFQGNRAHCPTQLEETHIVSGQIGYDYYDQLNNMSCSSFE
jgi:hypothetical protein